MSLTPYIKFIEIVRENISDSLILAEESILNNSEISDVTLSAIKNNGILKAFTSPTKRNQFADGTVVYFLKHLHFVSQYIIEYDKNSIEDFFIVYKDKYFGKKNYHLHESLIILLMNKLYDVNYNSYFTKYPKSKSAFLGIFCHEENSEVNERILVDVLPLINNQNLYWIAEDFKVYTKNHPQYLINFFSSNYIHFHEEVLIPIGITICSSLMTTTVADDAFNSFILPSLESNDIRIINCGIACLLYMNNAQLSVHEDIIKPLLLKHENNNDNNTLSHLMSFYINTLERLNYSEKAIERIIKRGNIDTVEFTIARNLFYLDFDKRHPLIEVLFDYLSRVNHTQKGTIETIGQYFTYQKKLSVVDLLDFIKKLVLNNRSNIKNIELFEYPIVTLANQRIEEFNKILTNWLNNDNSLLHILLERIVRQFHSKTEHLKLDSETVSEWNKNDVIFVVYKICGYFFYDKEILERFLYQIYKYTQHKIYIKSNF